jgi:hypothetical protein
MMSKTKHRKRKAPQFYISILFIFPALAGMLSSCGMVTNRVEIELSPTVENPATEELTLVPETEVATLMPTIITLTSEPTKTNTPEPTVTATETIVPTEVEKYPIDLEKLRNFPQSYEYLVGHPEEFVEAPNPLEDIDVFNQWWNEKFIPILGDRSEREKNMIMGGGGVLGDFFDIMNYQHDPQPLLGQPEMLFFKHEGVTYPIAIINVAYESDIATNFTMAIILFSGSGAPQGTGVIGSLSRGENIEDLYIILKENSFFPEIVNQIISFGLNGEFSEEHKLILGVGGIKTIP